MELEKKKASLNFILAPRHFSEKLGVEEAEKLVQKLAYQFGGLLCAWPDMIQAAKDLRKQGIRLSLPVIPSPVR